MVHIKVIPFFDHLQQAISQIILSQGLKLWISFDYFENILFNLANFLLSQCKVAFDIKSPPSQVLIVHNSPNNCIKILNAKH
jgi:hypothetical protein